MDNYIAFDDTLFQLSQTAQKKQIEAKEILRV